jgi:OOP family OmpA-OmpF porin
MATIRRSADKALSAAATMLALIGEAPSALANPHNAYVTAALGSSNYIDDDKYEDFDTDEFGFGWSVFGGYHFFPSFAVEAGYTDFGSFGATNGQQKAEERFTALYLAGVGMLPLRNNWSLYGKLGLSTVKQDQSFTFQANNTANSTAFLLGIGTQWAPATLQHWAFLVGLDTYSFEAKQAEKDFWQSVGLFSLGARFLF